jgi:hypothetical protein
MFFLNLGNILIVPETPIIYVKYFGNYEYENSPTVKPISAANCLLFNVMFVFSKD